MIVRNQNEKEEKFHAEANSNEFITFENSLRLIKNFINYLLDKSSVGNLFSEEFAEIYRMQTALELR